ncbi:class I SAM-dependent methyltransferase [Alkalihalobacterium sp. APHAB7]|uniref:class I SAM-dependent methyltransferase n=1 Tax=Alkalihalobacterium sp. APHAB7 TaxID=3402081 RepID=UPI003AABA72B
MNIQDNRIRIYEEKWQDGMKDWEGKLPERMVNDKTEEAFWKKLIKERENQEVPDRYAKEIYGALSSMFGTEDHVLEIGPGWGNYTFSLAEQVKKLTVVDSSRSILEYLKEACQMRQRTNVEFLHHKWEDIKFETDLHYDVVFGMNCFYRMNKITKALSLINQQAKRLAVIGMTTGPIQPHYEVLHEKYGYKVKHPRRDYIDLLQLLYSLGIYADCKMLPITRTYEFTNYEQLLKENTSKILTVDYKLKDVEKSLSKFVQFKDGKYIYDHHFHAAIISWSPKH